MTHAQQKAIRTERLAVLDRWVAAGEYRSRGTCLSGVRLWIDGRVVARFETLAKAAQWARQELGENDAPAT